MEFKEIIGYAASFFIVMSFIVTNIRSIRIINLLGCVCFVCYGVMQGMLWPVIIPNAVICFVQIYYLFFDKKQ